jgi:hypothetical protein
LNSVAHHGAKILRFEPVGEQFRAGERLLRHRHLVGHRPPPPSDFLPDTVSGREAPISMMQRRINPVRPKVTELMGSHVLQAQAHARGACELADLLKRKIPLAIVGNSIVD